MLIACEESFKETLPAFIFLGSFAVGAIITFSVLWWKG